jgi:hypothetical protein
MGNWHRRHKVKKRTNRLWGPSDVMFSDISSSYEYLRFWNTEYSQHSWSSDARHVAGIKVQRNAQYVEVRAVSLPRFPLLSFSYFLLRICRVVAVRCSFSVTTIDCSLFFRLSARASTAQKDAWGRSPSWPNLFSVRKRENVYICVRFSLSPSISVSAFFPDRSLSFSWPFTRLFHIHMHIFDRFQFVFNLGS